MPDTSPRTVLIVTPSSRLLGARRSLMTLAEGLDPSRWRAVVCGQSHGQLGEALDKRGIRMEVVKLGWWRKGKYFLWRPFAIARLAELARQVEADLIHCNEIYPNPYAVRAAASLSRLNEDGTVRRVPVLTHVRLGIRPDMIRKYDLGRAGRLAVVSHSASEEFDEWTDKEERVRVIYNGVNMEEFHRMRSPEEARRTLGLPADGFLMASIGQIGPRKGGDCILDAMETLLPRFPQLRLVLAGDTHKGQEDFAHKLRERAEQGALAGRVHFFPFTSDVLPFYEAADLNLLYSRHEGFGRTIIEAAAVGVPSIGANVGGIAEIIQDGVNGLLAEPENPQALASAIEAILIDRPRREELTENAFRVTAQRFSNKAHVDKVMDLYDEMIDDAS